MHILQGSPGPLHRYNWRKKKLRLTPYCRVTNNRQTQFSHFIC